jgi:hypothetical protein
MMAKCSRLRGELDAADLRGSFLELCDGEWRFDIGAIRATGARADRGELFREHPTVGAGGHVRGVPDKVGNSDGESRSPDARLGNEACAGLISEVRVIPAIFRLPFAVRNDCAVERIAG